MKRDSLLTGVIGVLIGGLIVWFLATSAVNNNATGMMQMMGIRNQNNLGGISTNIDRHFIEQMIPHHEDAITMAKLAQSKAQRSEVKELANNIIDSQEKEINQMKDWYKTWFNKEVPVDTQVMNQHGMMGNSNSTHMGISNLEKSTDFDRAFVEDMIPHHQMAVMMANMLLKSTSRPEMKKLAQDIIDAQTNEINDMRQWYKNWGY
ncbi:MAG: DUF305 domain-containing protein [Patescibacteria group bacterium]